MKIAETDWQPSVRIIPSRFPPIDLFETVASPADLDAVFALECLTNPRLREEIGDLSHVPEGDRVSGPGTSWIMAPFTHLNPNGSRFSPGTFGIYYAAKDLETAIAETIHHQMVRLRETNEPPQEFDMRVIHSHLRASLVELNAEEHLGLLNPNSYTESQVFGTAIRSEGRDGIKYPSVRRPGGECAAVFRPSRLAPCLQSEHLSYPWNGTEIPRSKIYVKSALPPPDH